MLLAAYFDESESQGPPPNVMTVAGYLVKSGQAHKMTREIGKGHAKFGISGFHQNDCAGGWGDYQGMETPERVKAQDYLRAVIKRRTIAGYAANVNIQDYKRIVGEGPDVPTPYAYVMFGVMGCVRRWIETTGFDGEIAYYFERGYKDETNGRRFIDYLMQGAESRADYRMATWTHADKRDLFPLQAADMLAWYCNQQFTRAKRGQYDYRKDFKALIRPQDRRIDHTPESLADFREVLDLHGNSALMRH